MRLIHTIACLFIFTWLQGQSKEIELIKTENGKEVTYHAKSLSRDNIILELNVTGSGFTTNVSLPVKIELKAFEKKEVVKITMGDHASYNISYKISKSMPSTSASTIVTKTETAKRPELEKGIVLFSKDGCGKCTYAKQQLKDKGKAFTEINISINQADQDYMWNKLQEAGFSGGSVQTPVFMVDGKMFFNMDLRLFLADLK